MVIILTIVISNHNCSKFVLNSLYCLSKLTKNDYKVVIRDNDSEFRDYLNLKKGVRDYPDVELYRIENLNFPAHLAHGTALNDLVQKIDTKYGVIMDADFTFLIKNWDEILIKQLEDDIPIIGAQSEPSNRLYRPVDFPFVFGTLFKNDIIKQLNIDFRPKLDENGSLIRDTSYQLRDKCLENGYKGKTLKSRNTRIDKRGPFSKIICGEYYLSGNEKIFGSHFARGHTLGKAKFSRGWKNKIYNLPIIGNPLLNSKGRRERNKWIKLCQKITNNN